MGKAGAISAFVFGAFLLAAGINHFIRPEFYAAFVPAWMSLDFANLGSGIAEIVLGLGLFLPRRRKWAALGAMVLMVVFLPLHVWDVLRDDPAIGSRTAAWVRLVVQLCFILWMGWLALQKSDRRFARRN
ncbi:MAG: hypothetical protein K9J06_12275 [Flavobacteriales bacterium]|nr:hypothetical protein [Flavobacteriales bacterium]